MFQESSFNAIPNRVVPLGKYCGDSISSLLNRKQVGVAPDHPMKPFHKLMRRFKPRVPGIRITTSIESVNNTIEQVGRHGVVQPIIIYRWADPVMVGANKLEYQIPLRKRCLIELTFDLAKRDTFRLIPFIDKSIAGHWIEFSLTIFRIAEWRCKVNDFEKPHTTQPVLYKLTYRRLLRSGAT